MRKTLDLSEDIPDEAMKATGIKSKKKGITAALEYLIRKSNASELKEYKGIVDLNMDLDAVRERQCRSKSILEV